MQNFQRQSLLCPRCRKLISGDEAACPYCGLTRPASTLRHNVLTRAGHDGAQAIRLIIIANIVMFVISILLGFGGVGMNMNPFTFLSPGSKNLLLLGATGTIPIANFGRWWSLLSANYLHGNLLHILFNMIALRQLGPLIVHEFGVSRFLVIYTLSGILGFLVSFFAMVPFTIGASAAVCGLIGAALYFGKSRGGSYGQAVYSQIGGWALSLFIFGFLVPGINNWGHGGGLVAGVVLAFLLGYQENRRETGLHRVVAACCVLATVLVLGWAVLSSIFYQIF